jgi:SNF2 family DNA or RNA helicase
MVSTATAPTRKHLDFIPDSLKYYPHQIDGVRDLAKMGSGILADEMGLGKSVQALTVFAVDVQAGWCNRALVVCPATLKSNWWAEIFEHTLFKNVTVLGSELRDDGTWRKLGPKARAVQLEDFRTSMAPPSILICNYEQVEKHVDDLNGLGFDVVIYDEAHSLKNPRAKRTKACMRLEAKRHLLLTGSPMLNHVNELWALLHRVAPKEYPNYYVFQHRYCVFGGFKDKQIVGVKNEKELTERLNSVMVRRLKADVLDLPDKQHIEIKVPLHPEQQELYDQVKNELYLPDPGAASGEDIANALTMFLRLKQICGTTATIEGYPDRSYKLDRAEEIVGELLDNGHKVVLFTQFRGVLGAMEARLSAYGTPMHVIHGDVPMGDRVPIVADWSHTPEPGVLLAMHQVAGVGLNMTAARHMVMLDKLFVPKMNEQSEDRIHRIGADKTQPVQYYELLCEGTVEYRVEQILRRKRRIFNDVVEDGNFRRKLYAAIKESA